MKPNIIFILADDLGYGDIGYFGQDKVKTPCLDQMAKEGMVFTNHYGGAPVCGPSRACLMSGKHQGTGYIKGNPVNGRDIPFREKDIIVSEVLKNAGYDTACIGKWGLGLAGSSGFPTKKGFDYFYGYDSHKSCHNYYPDFLWENEIQVPLKKGTYSHDKLTEMALDWIKQERSNPFFMYLAYTIPHDPYNPPNDKPYSDKDWPQMYKNYAAMITRMDKDVGRLMTLLRDMKIDKNTLVIFASDNGPGSEYNRETWEMVSFFRSAGDLRGMKRDVYDGGIRVPFIAHWPHTIKPGVSEHISAFQDILPTLAELADTVSPDGLDGISLVPTLLGTCEQKRHDKMYWEFIFMKEHKSRQSCLDLQGGWKGVRYGTKGKLELYNIYEDISEENDIADEYPDVVDKLQKYLDTVRTPSQHWPISEQGWKPEGVKSP